MNTQKLSYYIILIALSFSTQSLAQSVNDYRSVSSGAWTTLSVWEVYNGSAWVPATTYPGQVAGTNDVSIENGNSVTLSSNIPNSFNSLTVGDGTGATDQLLIGGTSSLNTPLVTIDNGGFISWIVNVTFSLPAGAAFVIETGGSIDTSNPCSASKRIVIGTVIYSSCNGGAGAQYSFSELNNLGGSLNVSPSSNSPICTNEILTLFSNVSGAGSGSATFSWSVNGPGGYSFSSTLADPTVSGLSAGTYTYAVQATNGSISNTDSVEVMVSNNPNTPTSGGNQTVCNGAALPTLTASVSVGETVDWYDSSTGGNLLLSGNSSFSPSTAGSYFAEARDTTADCISTSRVEIIATVVSCKVIMNRHINSKIIRN